MTGTNYRELDSDYRILKKILLTLAEKNSVQEKNKYREGDSFNNMMKKLLRMFYEDITFGGGGGGTGGLFFGTGDPNGVLTPGVVPAFYYDTVTKVIWVKTVGAGTNTNWE